MAIEIKATGKAIPSLRVSNDDLAKKIDTSDEWIRSHTGIGARHIADSETACSDLALSAAISTLEMMLMQEGCKEKSLEEIALTIDMIVLASATQDYFGCPSTSCVVQHKLGAKNAATMDITAGCTGFIYALETAYALLSVNSSRKRALVIGSDILTRFTDWSDRGSCVLFGDGAGAVLIEKTECTERRGILRTILRADGSGYEHLMIKDGGSRNPFKDSQFIEKAPYIFMNGHAVYNFAVKAVVEIIEGFLVEEKISIDDISRIIPHQANARIVSAAGKRLGIPEEKFFLNIEEYANTSAASIPIALDELNRSGDIHRGDLILMVGFGAGLTYGGNLIVF